MGGRIDLYIDIASLYSYIVLIQVLKTQDLLKQHSVEVDIHPVLLGAINAGSGNKPPWTLKAKAQFGSFDSQRSLRAVGLSNVSPPGDLFEAGRTQLALRALHHVKQNFPTSTYLATWRAFLHAFWTLHRPPINPEALRAALEGAIPVDAYSADGTPETGAKKLFSAAEVEQILKAASSNEYKDVLRASTDEALKRGAFGSPWLWVTNEATGKSEPFFGSDRWSHVYEFLGLPYQDVALLPPGAEKAKL
ncbi:thioredoxin-like protein [Hypoxylon trugodes]|uniref:thioredoxin-like protein n=1 Tax=Hypoxylon trugodes TaxID=326681 RepID=UPI00219A970C|nr:thioredoxin-like protein [Hypoxylon trugodes]KAI1393742.1 thioredoxin-like protein [Hypoxylon trugodes]